MVTTIDELITQLRDEHFEETDTDTDTEGNAFEIRFCFEDDEDWPCSIVRLLDEIQRLRAATDDDDAPGTGSDAMTSKSIFILFKIVESGGLTKAELHKNLTAPDGWWKLARLCGRGLVLVLDDEVVATVAGEKLVADLRQAGMSSTTAPADDAPDDRP